MSNEQALQLLRKVIHPLRDGVLLLNAKLQVHLMNPAAEQLLGVKREALNTRPIAEWLQDESLIAQLQHPLTEKIRVTLPATPEQPPLQALFLPLNTEGGILLAILERPCDCNQLAQRLHSSEEQLMQSCKMAAIGQLAAGVAHEINNPVGYVNSNLSTLSQYAEGMLALLEAYRGLEAALPADHPQLLEVRRLKESHDLDYVLGDLGNLLRESREGMDRVLKIIRDLKTFSHVDKEEWGLADLHAGLDSTLNIVNNELKYKAKVIKEYDPELPQIDCIATQLNQVFMNLLVNAAHAISDYGTIIIRTRRLDADWVCVDISDSGSGISAEQLPRIFEPYYTTKPHGKGTGLGLPMSRDIVLRHGGEISLESTQGQGTTFHIKLPIRNTATHPEPYSQP